VLRTSASGAAAGRGSAAGRRSGLSALNKAHPEVRTAPTRSRALAVATPTARLAARAAWDTRLARLDRGENRVGAHCLQRHATARAALRRDVGLPASARRAHGARCFTSRTEVGGSPHHDEIVLVDDHDVLDPEEVLELLTALARATRRVEHAEPGQS